MKRILDPAFRYEPSYATDVRRTFERIRREQEATHRDSETKRESRVRVVKLERQVG